VPASFAQPPAAPAAGGALRARLRMVKRIVNA
jgi:hypothetical protein